VLTEAGADLDLAENDETALAMAAYEGRTDVCRFFLSRGADPNNTGPRGDVFSALYAAAAIGNVETVRLLLANGADHKLRNRNSPDDEDFASAFLQARRRATAPESDVSFVDAFYSVPRVRRSIDRRICWNCQKQQDLCFKPFPVCTGCWRARYCSRKCQKEHWKEAHRDCCGIDDPET